MNAARKKPRWTRRKDARPEEIIAAALDLFAERGFAGARLEDVAARAGVSKGTLYLYFDNKEKLFKAVVRQNLVPVLKHAEELVDKFPGSPSELVRQLAHGWWRMVGSTKVAGIPKLIISEAGNFPDLAEFYYREVIQRGMRMFRRVIERGVASGEFRKLDVDPLMHVALAPLILLAVWRFTFAACERGAALQPERYMETYLEMLLSSLRNPKFAEKKRVRARA